MAQSSYAKSPLLANYSHGQVVEILVVLRHAEQLCSA